IIPMDRLQPGAMEALAAVELELRFLLEIPKEMTTATSLNVSSKILSFAVTGPARSGQLGSAERRLLGSAESTWEDPSDLILRLRDKATRRSPLLWQVLDPVGVPLAFASISIATQRISRVAIIEKEVDDKEADVVVVVVIASLCSTLVCMVLGFGLFKRFMNLCGSPNKMGARKADCIQDLQDIDVSEATQDEDEHADPPVEFAVDHGRGGHGVEDQQSYPSQHHDASASAVHPMLSFPTLQCCISYRFSAGLTFKIKDVVYPTRKRLNQCCTVSTVSVFQVPSQCSV
ncbi:PRY3, partial [Symbiodinium necroappetens]